MSLLSRALEYHDWVNLPDEEPAAVRETKTKCSICGSQEALQQVGTSEVGYWCLRCKQSFDEGFAREPREVVLVPHPALNPYWKPNTSGSRPVRGLNFDLLAKQAQMKTIRGRRK